MALPKIKPYTYVDREHSNRVSWPVDPSRAVLLVHDMQVHFVQAFEGANLGESNDNPDAQINIAIRNLRRLIDAAHAAGIPVYYTAQPPRQNPEDRRLLIDFWGDGLQNDESAPRSCAAPSRTCSRSPVATSSLSAACTRILAA